MAFLPAIIFSLVTPDSTYPAEHISEQRRLGFEGSEVIHHDIFVVEVVLS
jgi:hypothetical protein